MLATSSMAMYRGETQAVLLSKTAHISVQTALSFAHGSSAFPLHLLHAHQMQLAQLRHSSSLSRRFSCATQDTMATSVNHMVIQFDTWHVCWATFKTNAGKQNMFNEAYF